MVSDFQKRVRDFVSQISHWYQQLSSLKESRHCKGKLKNSVFSCCAGEFAAQPEDVTCFSSNFHYAYFHCIPSNTSFLSIDWYINGSIGEKTSSSRHDQMKMKLNCSQLYSNTSIQCAVRYSETCLYSRNASLCVEGK